LSKKLGVWIMATMLIVAACGDDEDTTGVNGTNFTAEERAALIEALTTTGAFVGSPAAAYASLALAGLDEIGTISASQAAAIDGAVESGISLAVSGALATEYDAFGVQISYDVGGATGWFKGVVGWTGLDTDAKTVDELVSVYSYGDDQESPPSNLAGSLGVEEPLIGTYWNGATYYATDGEASITSSNFSGSTDCSVTGVTCSYAKGTMSGNFGFTADAVSGTYEQDPVGFSGLPAVYVTISVSN
jgi:hypothetical protein